MKKITVFLSLVLLLAVFAGCAKSGVPADTTAPQAPEVILPLTKQSAILLALHHAGVSNEEVRHLHAWQDTDGGVVHYDVDFRHGDYYYAYEISEASGELLKLETEYDRTALPEFQIEAEAAWQIALAHEGFTADSVTAPETEFDAEDHRYEVEFTKDGVHYTFEICAEYGKILDIDKDLTD